MNQLGSAGTSVAGSLLSPGPVDETVALEQARAQDHHRELAESEERAREAERLELAGRPDAGRPKDQTD